MIAKSKTVQFAAKALVTLTVFWLVFRGVDFSHWRAMLKNQDGSWLAVVVALTIFQITLGSLRWKMILETIASNGQTGMSFLQTVRIFYIGMFFNSCMPGTIGGDAVRVWLAKSDQVPLTLATHSVIIDRLIGLLALCSLIVLVLVPIGSMAGFNALPLLLAIIAAGAFGFWLIFYIDRIMAKWQHQRFIAWMLYLAANMRLLLKRPASSFVMMAFGIIGHVMYCMIAYALARSLGIEVGLLQCIILIPPVPLAAALPISIGGWGVREAGIVTMLALAGVSRADALILSVQLGLATIVTSLPGGMLWLMQRSQNK